MMDRRGFFGAATATLAGLLGWRRAPGAAPTYRGRAVLLADVCAYHVWRAEEIGRDGRAVVVVTVRAMFGRQISQEQRLREFRALYGRWSSLPGHVMESVSLTSDPARRELSAVMRYGRVRDYAWE